MDSETLDFIIRGRTTILEILESRGYNVDTYKGMSPESIMKFATTNVNLLTIKSTRESDGMKVTVLYWVSGAIRLKLDAECEKLYKDSELDPLTDEVIILLSEPFHDAFHVQSVKRWTNFKARVSFFQIKNLISNPAKHIFVPPHRKLSPEEMTSVIHSLHMKSKSEFPHIKYHIDMQARILGLIPGDVVEIRRPSETAGEYTAYRVCVL